MRPLIFGLAIAIASPALAADDIDRAAWRNAEPAPQEDWNSYWLDYKTDISEAKRELRKDLRRAKTPSDRREAWAEYRREVADAQKDYRKEMREKGYVVGNVAVTD
jgi:hypothetical protein